MCKIFHRQWISWYGAFWRTSVIADPVQLSASTWPEHKGAHSLGGLGKYSSQRARTLERRGPPSTRTHKFFLPQMTTWRCPRGDEFDSNLMVWTTGNSANPASACGVRQRKMRSCE